MNVTPLERFMDKVSPEPMSGCWLWTACVDRHGYGRYGRSGTEQRSESAQRSAWRFFRGEPGDLHVLHKCDMPSCVNPDHLFLGTHIDNMLDRVAKGRKPSGRGERHWSAKLTANDVHAIRKAAAGGETTRSLGARFGVLPRQIRRVLTRTNWGSVHERGATEAQPPSSASGALAGSEELTPKEKK